MEVMSMGKGVKAERDLSDTLEDEYGYAAMRSPGSGGTTQRARADIIAVRYGDRQTWYGDRHTVHLVELKVDPDGSATFHREEGGQLSELAQRAGGIPWLAVKPDLRSHSQWYFRQVKACHQTDRGNYSIRIEDHDHCRSIAEAFG
jgi:Holliday junction resolvase